MGEKEALEDINMLESYSHVCVERVEGVVNPVRVRELSTRDVNIFLLNLVRERMRYSNPIFLTSHPELEELAMALGICKENIMLLTGRW